MASIAAKQQAQQFKEEGNRAYQEHDYLRALEFYTKALQQDRNNAAIWGNRAATYHALGIYEKAIEDATYAIEIGPTAKYYWRKGMAHLALGQLYSAKLAFQNGLKRDSSNAELRDALAQRQPGEPNYTNAMASMSWEQKRQRAVELKDAGNQLFTQKKYREAKDKYTQAVQYDPADSTFYNNRAAVEIELGELENALEDCKRAISIGKTSGVSVLGNTSFAEPRLMAKAYTRLATVYERSNKWAEAVQAYRDAIQAEDSEVLRQKLAAAERHLH